MTNAITPAAGLWQAFCRLPWFGAHTHTQSFMCPYPCSCSLMQAAVNLPAASMDPAVEQMVGGQAGKRVGERARVLGHGLPAACDAYPQEALCSSTHLPLQAAYPSLVTQGCSPPCHIELDLQPTGPPLPACRHAPTLQASVSNICQTASGRPLEAQLPTCALYASQCEHYAGPCIDSPVTCCEGCGLLRGVFVRRAC